MNVAWKLTIFGLTIALVVATLVVVIVAPWEKEPIVSEPVIPVLIYGYECRESKCVKVELTEQNFNKALSLPVCRIFCGDDIGTLWPKPTGNVKYNELMVHIDRSNIQFNVPSSKKQVKLWEDNEKRFLDLIEAQIPDVKILKQGGRSLTVQIATDDSQAKDIPTLTLKSDESYTLEISLKNENVIASITAPTYFGARHGLETLSQLLVYDDIRREIQMMADVQITDAPAYPWRALSLDTSRNFYSLNSIKRTLDGMAMTKLNTFHWHITDSHSFPMEVKSQPELYKLGAYSQRKIYSHEDIADIVEYARVRGIRVMPEFDAPAHVGEGWQHKNMTACFNAQPWKNYCVEPPCGQLDPTVTEMYSVLEDIYREMFELFNPDIFHMGGDEVSVGCWNSSERIKNWMLSQEGWGLEEKDFLRLWGDFQKEALNRVDRIAKTNETQIILWTSSLTEAPYIDEYLNKDRYTIQIWTTGTDPKIQEILKRGFKVIVSNYDVLYLDCGGGGWVNEGQNWCSPYATWQSVYENDLKKIAGDYISQVWGAEATIWSESVDDFTLDSRYWPRASALGERLWSNPQENWRLAEPRILLHRERLVSSGLGAQALQPEWCLQNENDCPIDAYDPKN